VDADRLLDGLTAAQREAVTTPSAPLCILAAAGSGKTRVLTRRIAWRVANGDADASHVLALTFTRKAATELQVRLRRLGLRDSVTAGTFHAIAYAQLRARWADRRASAPALLERKGRLLGPLVTGTPRSIVEAAAATVWAAARLVDPDRYVEAVAAAGRRTRAPAEVVAGVYAGYVAEKRKRRLVDFDDLLAGCANALADDDEFAAAQRWRFRHLFVDEFQDVNPLQHRLLERWRGPSPDLCVVGDPNQAIYGWNGADARYLADFARHHPGAAVIELAENHRSSPQIVAAAAAVLGRRPPATTRPGGPVPQVRAYRTDREEAAGIARAIRDRHAPGTSWSGQAVLVRTNAQTALIEEALRATGVPHRVRGSGSFIQQPEVRASLRDLSSARVPFPMALADVAAAVAASPLAGDADDGTTRSERAAERQANLETVVRLGYEYLALDPAATADGFASWLTATVRDDDSERRDAVDVATFHAAKGLEWPVVHLAGVEEGLVPIAYARTRVAAEEERRLFHVALTRAEQEVAITWAQERTFGTRTVARQRSPYVDAVLAAGAADEAEGSVPPATWRQHLERDRTILGPAGAQDPVLAALENWRRNTARAADVSPGAILDDTALAALAELRPTDVDCLRSVPGLSPLKAARFGPAIVDVVRESATPV
jgi:DNA helicase-2/ATP-dependent DNA helicase PcrA